MVGWFIKRRLRIRSDEIWIGHENFSFPSHIFLLLCIRLRGEKISNTTERIMERKVFKRNIKLWTFLIQFLHHHALVIEFNALSILSNYFLYEARIFLLAIAIDRKYDGNGHEKSFFFPFDEIFSHKNEILFSQKVEILFSLNARHRFHLRKENFLNFFPLSKDNFPHSIKRRDFIFIKKEGKEETFKHFSFCERRRRIKKI